MAGSQLHPSQKLFSLCQLAVSKRRICQLPMAREDPICSLHNYMCSRAEEHKWFIKNKGLFHFLKIKDLNILHSFVNLYILFISGFSFSELNGIHGLTVNFFFIKDNKSLCEQIVKGWIYNTQDRMFKVAGIKKKYLTLDYLRI